MLVLLQNWNWTFTDRGNMKKMKAEISGARTEKEKECKLSF